MQSVQDDDDDDVPLSSSQETSDDSSSARHDAILLYAARFVRMLSFGGVTVVLYVLLAAIGLDGAAVGTLLSGILAGDLIITLFLTTSADTCGRRRVLITGSMLAFVGALALSSTNNFTILLLAGVIGVISPAGGEVGPFRSVEQAALAELTARDGGVAALAAAYGKYLLIGSIAQGMGSLIAGWLVASAQAAGFARVLSLRIPVLLFGLAAIAKAFLYMRCSPRVEEAATRQRWATSQSMDPKLASCCKSASAAMPCKASLSPHSRMVILRLSALFAVDAFAGGFTMLTFISYWLHARWAISLGWVGAVLAAVNLASGLSDLVAGKLVARFGAVETMVYTHLPSNVLLMMVPLMPNREMAVLMLIVRNSISQMDVPAREAYVAWQVHSNERSAAGGITGIARSLGLSLSPLLLGVLSAADPGSFAFDSPFYVAGSLKIAYDLTLWRHFRQSEEGDGGMRRDDVL